MADITLNEFSFTLPSGSNMEICDGPPRVASCGGPKSPPRAACDPRRGPGASRDDAISIPSDDESDYDSDEACEPDKPDDGNLGSGQSDMVVLPGEVSVANNDKESGGVGGRDHSFSASFGTGGDDDAVETSTVKGPGLDNDALGTEYSLTPRFPPVSPERRSASAEPLQLAYGHPNPVDNIHSPSSGSGFPLPEAATCDEGAKGLPSASPVGGEGLSSSGSLSGLCSPGPEDHSGREGMPFRRPVGEFLKASGNSNGEVETPTAKRSLRRRKAAVRCESRHASSSSIISPDDENDDQQSEILNDLQTHPGNHRHGHGGDDAYHPQDSESDQDKDARLPPPKRRKRGFPASTLRRTAAEQETGSCCSDRRGRQVQRRSTFKKRQSRYGIPSPPSSQGPGKEIDTMEAHFAGFEQWRLPNAVLKRATVNGKATFQLEFSWGPCANHKRRDASPCRQQRKPPAERRHSSGQSPASAVAAPTPADEEEWEVQQILASRVHCEELQYQVKWVNWEDDQEWYYADGFKKSPRLLKRYHHDHPEMPGPPVRLELWLRAYEDDAEDDDHPDDNRPVGVALIEATTGATTAKDS